MVCATGLVGMNRNERTIKNYIPMNYVDVKLRIYMSLTTYLFLLEIETWNYHEIMNSK